MQFVIWDEYKEITNLKLSEVTGNSTKTCFSITFAYCSGKDAIVYILSKFSVYILEIGMTSLLTHIAADSTRHSFRSKSNDQPLKKFLSLVVG